MLRDFPVDASLVPLNHASYGLPTTDLLERAEQVRRELESDANTNLGEGLTHRLGGIARQVHDWLNLPGGELALTPEHDRGRCGRLRVTPPAPRRLRRRARLRVLLGHRGLDRGLPTRRRPPDDRAPAAARGLGRIRAGRA